MVPHRSMKEARRAMIKELQSKHGLTRARTEGLPDCATRTDTGSIDAVASHGGTSYHRDQLHEPSRPIRVASPGLTWLPCSTRRPLAWDWVWQVPS